MQNSNVDSSWKSIFAVTIPIVLSNLSEALMCNIDRFMIIQYSVDAFNAVSASGNLFAVFSFLFIGIANAAEVFVGQYNGAKDYKSLSSPVWQMVYFAIVSSLIFFPVGYFSEYFNLLPKRYFYDGVSYQKIMMYSGPLFPMFIAFSAFFVGQGRALIVTFAIIIGSVLNIVLDYALIYGIDGIAPRLGAAGAAIATAIAQFAQVLIMLIAFCSKSNRKMAFASCRPNKKVFLGCIKIGAPLSISNFLVMLAWYLVMSVVNNSSSEQATIYSISVAIYMLVISLGEGLSRATATVTANMIGRKDLKAIRISFKKFIFLALISALFFVIPMSFFPENCIFNLLSLLKEDISAIYSSLEITLHWISFNVLLESVLCIIWGILVAGGDTIYPTVVYQSFIWGFVVVPMTVCYFCNYNISAVLVYQFSILWLIGSLTLFYRRYLSMKWYNKLV